MSVGPTQRLLQRARDWAGDAEELAALQWQLLQLELGELVMQLRRSLLLFALAGAVLAIGLPLAIIAGVVVLAQTMDWPVANALAIAGVAFVVVAGGLWFAAKRSWAVEAFLPRSRLQARQNLRTVFASWQVSSVPDDLEEDEYYPD